MLVTTTKGANRLDDRDNRCKGLFHLMKLLRSMKYGVVMYSIYVFYFMYVYFMYDFVYFMYASVNANMFVCKHILELSVFCIMFMPDMVLVGSL